MSGSVFNAAPLPAFTAMNRIRVMRLYRRALKLQMSWTPRYDVFRSQAMEIRRRFEANQDVSDPRSLQKIIENAEKELYENRHPDPYIPPTRPGGTKWERNIPPPRIQPPNFADFVGFQTYSHDQRPYWRIFLDMPRIICMHLGRIFFPNPDLSDIERQQLCAKNLRDNCAVRDAKVEEIISVLDLPPKDIPAYRRYEKLIYESKLDMNEWDWDALFADIEDTGDREALYLAIFQHYTKKERLRRERFHREGLERENRLDKDLTPVEKREFLAKEIAIAAAHGHIGNLHYAFLTQSVPDPEGVVARDKLYKTLVVDFFIPHLEKFRRVVANRDDWSLVEQTRFYWQPKEQLIAKIDKLLAISRLQKNFNDAEKAEWIYELYMAPKFYTEMELRPGAALEFIYWTQGKECVPEGYVSPDEENWAAAAKMTAQARKEVEETKRSLREEFEKKGYIGAS